MMNKFGNRFSNFAAEDEEGTATATQKPQQKKVQAPKEQKKVVVKVAKQPVAPQQPIDDSGEAFETATDKRKVVAQRQGKNNTRGGRPETGRGGRGRGRPRTAGPTEEGEAQVERAERGGQRERFAGKPREEGHPFDRQSGTGRGKRDQRKGGHGKGGWGKEKKPESEEVAEGEERKTEGETPAAQKDAEKQAEKPKEEPVVVEEPEQEEEVGFTLDDYLKQKEANSKGLLKAAEGRQHEKFDQKKIEENTKEKDRAETKAKQLAGKDVYAKSRGEGVELFGFQGNDDDFEPSNRGGPRGGARGGRGRGGRDQRPPRENRGRGGNRKGGKLIVDDNQFPLL